MRSSWPTRFRTGPTTRCAPSLTTPSTRWSARLRMFQRWANRLVPTVLFVALIGGSVSGGNSSAATGARTAAKNTTTKKAATTAKKSATTAKSTLIPLAKPSAAATQGVIDKAWTPDKPIVGWDLVPNDSWPATGAALAIEARAEFIDVRQKPSVGAKGLRFQTGRSTTGPVTFLAIRDYGEWIQVEIPVRPNGTVGWVQGKDVSRITVPDRLVIELSTNTMIVEKNSVEVSRYPVSSGTGGTPTPTGLFYLSQLIVEVNSTGPYGPYIFGTSAYSEVLTSFAGGHGAVGIHGTNRPDAIGDSVSHGCIRVTNDVVTALTRVLPLGTPVEIVQRLADLPVQRRANAEPDPDPVVDVASGAVVIDFPLQPQELPARRLEEIDAVDVTPR
jgi:lipoprotein-anchoring transpeptidase ErfK/SrfK